MYHRTYTLILVIIGVIAALFMIFAWKTTVVSLEAQAAVDGANDGPVSEYPLVRMRQKKMKPARIAVKGVYLTAYSAGNSKKMDEIIKLIDDTELNAVVIDIKDYSGKILFASKNTQAQDLKLIDNRVGDLRALVLKLKKHGIYTIARQTVFQDPILAEKKPEWALKSVSGGLWRDNKGLAWVNPNNQAVWDYNVAIAKEAIGLGFDEINFDYVRFPSDGVMRNIVYANGDKTREEVMGEFFKYLRTELGREPAWLSIDMFGFVMERHDGMSIGQRLEDAVDSIDYICPMMYPSHYPSGHLGLVNPAAYPREVFENGMKKGLPYFEGKRASVRPWIQAFNMGAVYDAEKIRAQIDIVEKYSDAGWLMWNAANRYTGAGLNK
ncbi:MAG TPA: putative glycoside hydrolase [Candidatus Magasanikbacteria bacterium]|nr:putative glycoside hydrolase [Candidatus Magasanikbacteria bacterium]